MNPPIRRLWWLNPVWLFAAVVGSTIFAAAVQSDASFRLYGTPKYIDEWHVLLAGLAVLLFSLGGWFGQSLGSAPRATPAASDRLVRLWFWITFVLTLFGYTVWAGVGFKNGFSLDMLGGLVGSSDPYAEETVRQELFPTIPGVTTCTHFSVPAVMLGLWLYLRGDRRVVWPMLVILGLGLLRALLWRERSAVIALVVPAMAVWLRVMLSRPLSLPVRTVLQLGPVLGAVALVVFFGGFEYFRSWQYYEADFDSFAEFTLWRVSGYYTTAHNNGAMAVETQPPLPLPYWTFQPFWKFPGVGESGFSYHALTGIDPSLEHVAMLQHYGTQELNNEGGLFMPLIDYGLFGFMVFWCGSGYVAGRLYRGLLAGTLAGVTLYPLVFLAILETPLILYLFFPASFPAFVTLAIVVWFASRDPGTVRVYRPSPLIASGYSS